MLFVDSTVSWTLKKEMTLATFERYRCSGNTIAFIKILIMDKKYTMSEI
jgi:hypothetical protein